MPKPATKRRSFKNTGEFLAQLERDVTRWRLVAGNVDTDRIFALGFDGLFAEFGIPIRIGEAPARATLLRMREEALAKKDQTRASLLAECLRVINAALREQT
jgi:hypothetical protein